MHVISDLLDGSGDPVYHGKSSNVITLLEPPSDHTIGKMDLLTETISTASQNDTSRGAVLAFNDQRSGVIRTLNGNCLNPKGTFVTGQVLSSSRAQKVL